MHVDFENKLIKHQQIWFVANYRMGQTLDRPTNIPLKSGDNQMIDKFVHVNELNMTP